MDADEFKKRGYEMIEFICGYLDNVKEQKVCSSVIPGYLKKMIPGLH